MEIQILGAHRGALRNSGCYATNIIEDLQSFSDLIGVSITYKISYSSHQQFEVCRVLYALITTQTKLKHVSISLEVDEDFITSDFPMAVTQQAFDEYVHWLDYYAAYGCTQLKTVDVSFDDGFPNLEAEISSMFTLLNYAAHECEMLSIGGSFTNLTLSVAEVNINFPALRAISFKSLKTLEVMSPFLTYDPEQLQEVRMEHVEMKPKQLDVRESPNFSRNLVENLLTNVI